LEMAKNNLPLFARSVSWVNKSLRTAAAAWINAQLPLEKLAVNAPTSGPALNVPVGSGENSYVEPNLDLINELSSDNDMLLKMFTALQLDKEVIAVIADLNAANANLAALRQIVVKELTGEKLTADDNETISNFVGQFTVDATVAPANKRLTLKAPQQKTGWQEDLSRLKLMVLTHQEGDNKVFSVGPVWDYQEGR